MVKHDGNCREAACWLPNWPTCTCRASLCTERSVWRAAGTRRCLPKLQRDSFVCIPEGSNQTAAERSTDVVCGTLHHNSLSWVCVKRWWPTGDADIGIFERASFADTPVLAPPDSVGVFLAYLLSYSMQQSPSRGANRSLASQEIPAFYGTRMFITAFTSARHLCLSWAGSIQSIRQHPSSWRSILILSSHLGLCLPSGFFPSETHCG